VLDSSAPIRLLDSEAGAERVKEIIRSARLGLCAIEISAVNWGEIVLAIGRRYDVALAERVEAGLLRYPLTVVPVDVSRAARAGRLKLKYKIGYADAFGVELALDSPNHILVTADYGVKPAEPDVQIEFLPTKP
jgi:predicted nucleic acid-binding protein